MREFWQHEGCQQNTLSWPSPNTQDSEVNMMGREMTKDDWATLCHTRLGMPKKDRSTPKEVHLVGLGPTHTQFLMNFLGNDPPEFIANADAVWTINRGLWFMPHDLVFVMDHIQGEANISPVYGAKMWKHDRPILTSDNCEGWPSHVYQYPFESIEEWAMDRPHPPDIAWIANSVPYMFLYAAYIGVEKLHLWGIDYHHHTSSRCEEGKANATYWARFAEENGVEIYIPPKSTFMDMNNRGFFYGYQEDPRKQFRDRREKFKRLIDDVETN